MKRSTRSVRLFAGLGCLILAVALLAPPTVQAQDRPRQRDIRGFIPPDQLVSFLPATPFNQFVQFIDPIFQRVTGKQIIDPESRTEPIGISIAGWHFLDAFEQVLAIKGLTYRETDRFFIIEVAPVETEGPFISGLPLDNVPGAAEFIVPATMDTREIKINAMLFELNHTKAKDVGLDWSVIFGENNLGSAGGAGIAATANTDGDGDGAGPIVSGLNFFLKTSELFDGLGDMFVTPDVVGFRDLARFFRILEENGIGETIANPSVTVQSGEQGRMQVGSDVPVQVRDFSGNTITQFFSTGIIIDVTPTLIQESLTDSLAGPTFDFMHLNVKVEKSGSRPSASGPVIDRSSANTQVLLLDGEQTALGGLYSTDESISRRGIPILKDLPGWFFGMRYIFGRTQTTVSQKELLIVIQAEMLDPLEVRASMPFQNRTIEEARRDAHERALRFQQERN